MHLKSRSIVSIFRCLIFRIRPYRSPEAGQVDDDLTKIKILPGHKGLDMNFETSPDIIIISVFFYCDSQTRTKSKFCFKEHQDSWIHYW